MARSARVNGKVKPFLSLSNLSTANGGVSAIAPSDDLIGIELGDGEGNDPVTFSDFEEGIAPLALTVTATYSGDKNSLYHVLWNNSGRTGVPFVYGRHGAATAVSGKPVLSGTVSIAPKAGWTAEANDGEPDQFEAVLQIEGTPVWTHV